MADKLVQLKNEHLSVDIYSDGTGELVECRNSRRWQMGPVAIQEERELDPGDCWQRQDRSYCEQYAARFRGRREKDGICFTLLGQLGAEMGTFTCRYRLEGPWLVVEILEISETLPNLMFPTAIESEQILIPSGVGKRVGGPGYKFTNFNRHFFRYPGNLNMRFFGGLRADAGWLGILEQGCEDAGVLQTALAITPGWLKSLGKWQGTRSVRYRFTEGGYVGVAKAFRGWAKEHGLFKTLTEKIQARPAVRNLIGGRSVIFWPLAEPFRQKSCEDRCEPVPADLRGREKKIAVKCDYRQMRRLMEECKALGMRQGIFQAGGWEQGGLDESHPDIWPPEPSLGTVDELRALCQEADPFITCLCDNYADAYPQAASFPKGVCRRRDGSLLAGGDWCGGQSYLLNSRAGVDYARRNWESLKTLGLRGIYPDTLSGTQFNESYDNGQSQTRVHDSAYKQQLMRFFVDQGLVLGSENGQDLAIPYVDFTHWNFAVRKPGESVPLWPLVYHDCIVGVHHIDLSDLKGVPFSFDQNRLIAMLYGCQGGFREWGIADSPVVRKRFTESLDIDEWHKQIGAVEMTSHKFLSDDCQVEQTEYANGAAIVVNFSDTEFRTDGASVPAHSYKIR